MKKFNTNIFSGFLGVSSGLAGLASLSRCSGSCSSCFGCAGTGLFLLLAVLGHTIIKKKDKKDGMV